LKCDICKKDKPWLEVIGSDFVCHACIQKENILLGKILRTHMDSFQRILKKKKIQNFEEFKKLSKDDIKDIVNVSHALNLKY
jgi:iron uptake system EfeUOB component EfeO/EfeM